MRKRIVSEYSLVYKDTPFFLVAPFVRLFVPSRGVNG